MLGAPCSPCCGDNSCTADDIDSFWGRMSTASVSLTLSGTSVERNAYTIHREAYNAYTIHREAYAGGTANGSHWGNVTVYQGTTSPIGTWPMAFVPEAPYDPTDVTRSFHVPGLAAQVVYVIEQNGIIASLRFILSVSESVTMSSTTPFSSTNVTYPAKPACKCRAWLYVRQNIVEREYAASNLFGTPREATTSPNGLPLTVRWYAVDYLSGSQFNAFGFRLPGALGGLRLGDLYASASSPVGGRSYPRDYFFLMPGSANHADAVGAMEDGTGFYLNFQQDSRSILLPRLVDSQTPWLSNPGSPERVGAGATYTVSGSLQQDTKAFDDFATASSSVTPVVQFEFQ